VTYLVDFDGLRKSSTGCACLAGRGQGPLSAVGGHSGGDTQGAGRAIGEPPPRRRRYCCDFVSPASTSVRSLCDALPGALLGRVACRLRMTEKGAFP
jgi:hypothetical protein